MGRLVINGEEVYELDEACLQKKNEQLLVKNNTEKEKTVSLKENKNNKKE